MPPPNVPPLALNLAADARDGRQSPREGKTSPRQSARATLANFGSLLPRPGDTQNGISWSTVAQPAPDSSPGGIGTLLGGLFGDSQAGPGTGRAGMRSPRQSITAGMRSPRGKAEASPRGGIFGIGSVADIFTGGTSPRGNGGGVSGPSLHKALGTRGGVVRAQDGFEVFYGVEENRKSPRQSKVAKEQDSRDGYEIFYGIPSREQRAARTSLGGLGAAGNQQDTTSAQQQQPSAPDSGQRRQLESQLSARLARPSRGSQGRDDVQSQSQAFRWAGAPAMDDEKSSRQEDCGSAKVPTSEVNVGNTASGEQQQGAGGVPLHGRPGRVSLTAARVSNVPDGVPIFPMSRSEAAVPKGVETYSLCGLTSEDQG